MKEFGQLTWNEIKKINRYATKKNGVPCEITGYGHNEQPDDFGLIDVKCEICTIGDNPKRMPDVLLVAYLKDRRRSFIVY